MTGPEMIWVEGEESCPYFYDASELSEASGPLVGYVRADIHDEVRSYLASCIAMIEHAIGPGNDVFIEPDTKRRLSDARAALARTGEG